MSFPFIDPGRQSSGPANLLMMQAAHSADLDDPSLVETLNGAHKRRILVQRKVSVSFAVILHIPSKDLSDMSLAQNDEVIETLSADTADHPLGIGVLPGRMRGSRHVLYPKRSELAPKDLTIDGISIPDCNPRGVVNPTRLEKLPSNPFG